MPARRRSGRIAGHRAPAGERRRPRLPGVRRRAAAARRRGPEQPGVRDRRPAAREPEPYPDARFWVAFDAGEPVDRRRWDAAVQPCARQAARHDALAALADIVDDELGDRRRAAGGGRVHAAVGRAARDHIAAASGAGRFCARAGRAGAGRVTAPPRRNAGRPSRCCSSGWSPSGTRRSRRRTRGEPRRSAWSTTGSTRRTAASDLGGRRPAVVSIAGYGGPTPNGIRIGPVYTPPELRGRGYATALWPTSRSAYSTAAGAFASSSPTSRTRPRTRSTSGSATSGSGSRR